MITIWIACFAGGYLLGSIPYADCRAHGVDIGTQGQNIAATNVGRVLGANGPALSFSTCPRVPCP